jgi:riboflavin kinase/FMN adenylyltransferase
MQHYRSLDDVHLGDVWLTIGSFDGVHRGHQTIIRALTAGAREAGLPAILLTFYPHPVAILRGQNFPYYLTSPDEKAEFLESLGIDAVITHPFNRKVANKSSYQFISDLKNHLTIKHLQVGYDFAMGKDRDGDFRKLKILGENFGFIVKKCLPIEDEGGVISSSRIRFLLGVGQVKEAAKLLGKNYSVQGMVEVGDQRGRTLGYPTANLAVWSEKIIPTAGVYACFARLRGKNFAAVTNIGVRPTFGSSPGGPKVETHLIDQHHEIYGENIQLEFVARLRDEKRFASSGNLKTQIQLDIIKAIKLLST